MDEVVCCRGLECVSQVCEWNAQGARRGQTWWRSMSCTLAGGAHGGCLRQPRQSANHATHNVFQAHALDKRLGAVRGNQRGVC